MSLQQVISVLFGVSIFAFFIFYLKQIMSWTKSSFRWGMVVYKFQETFPFEPPKHLIDKTIELKGVTFKFVSQSAGLFQTTVRRGRRGFFSTLLLGEIVLDKTGAAKITLRLPFTFVSLFISIWIALIGWITLDKSSNADLTSTLYPLGAGFIVVVIFGIISFLIKKDDAHSGVRKIKEFIVMEQN